MLAFSLAAHKIKTEHVDHLLTHLLFLQLEWEINQVIPLEETWC